MSELKFKAYGELEISEALSDASHVIIEENGDVKRFPANSIGKVKTVNGAEPDESGNVAVEIPAPVQPDLSQNDPEAPDYVKGRTHWKESVETPILIEQTISGQTQVTLENGFSAEGADCIVVWDGVEYNQKVKAYSSYGYYVGNISIGQGEGTGEPFVVVSLNADGGVTNMVVPQDGGEHVVKVVEVQNTYHKIPSEYLEDRVYNYTTDITSVDDWDTELKKIENAMKTEGKLCFYDGDDQHDGFIVDVTELYLLVASVKNHSLYCFDYEGWHGFPEYHYIETSDEWSLGYIRGLQSVPVYFRIPSGSNVFRRKPFVLYSDEDTNEPYGTGIIIKSSTSGSSKLFNITVDDNGTLTATEV